MSSKDAGLYERYEEIAQAVASETGMKVSDRYPCLIRVGDNWREYPFNWEPFRDLAGPISWPEDAPAIVVISNADKLSEPIVTTFSEPHPHVRIEVSPSIPVATIVETWIAQLADNVPVKEEPYTWFLQNLDLEPESMTPIVRQFLGLAPATRTKLVQLSSTVQGVEREIGQSKVTAFAITQALKDRHDEYASHRLGKADLAAPEHAASHTWEVWRDSVANLYDENNVAKSHHKVIDGRLFLVGLGLYEKPLREALEKADVWAPLLLEIDESVVGTGGPLREALNSVQLAHGYKNDRTEGDDQLGIQGEVNALCEVIMDPKVLPPLAVGLFGAWGSGKSFFMEKMRERVHMLTTGTSANHQQTVVQIRFNAWHYADTSLWASLAVEIFERLADPEPVNHEEREKWLKGIGDPNKEVRKNILANLETYREAKAALESEKERLKAEQTRLRKARDKTKKARQDTVAKFQLTNVALALAEDEDVQADLESIADDLGLKPAINQLTTLASELQTASGYITATWRKIKNKTGTIGLLVTAFMFLVLAVPAVLAGGSYLVGGLVAAVSSVASTVIAASQQILPAANSVNQGFSQINATLEKVSKIREKLAAQRLKEEQALEFELAQQDRQIDEATRNIAALNEKIATLVAEVDALTVGRRLYNFLADRAAGYQKHQGVLGMLHRDFRLLDAQLRAQPSDGDSSGLPRIDRVVLYIDDLDRCSPAKVLEVLEAVHLLLALELFIVVVGVDPRWLQRSLRHQYRDLSLSDDLTQDPYLQTMPTEYLEKIFQIPLTLPVMENKAYSKLISSLAPGTALPDSQSIPEVSGGSTRRAASPDSPGGPRKPTRALLQVQAGSAAEGHGGTSIDLTSEEVQFAQKLGGLVDTPRAAKRLMNTYRLIRATQHVGSRSRFLGADGNPGEYYAVLTLLAIAAGYPTLADRVLVALEDETEQQHISNWEDFLTELELGNANLAQSDIAPPPEKDLLSLADEAKWENMFTGLKASLSDNQLYDLEPYRRWGRTVARFSFTL